MWTEEAGRLFADGHPLRPDIGMAFSCYERAIFFETTAPPVLEEDDEANEENGVAEAAKDGSQDFDPYLYITEVYADAGSKLYDRLADVTSSYFRVRKRLRAWGVQLADRDPGLVDDSREALLQSFRALLQQIKAKNKLQKTSGWQRSLKEFRLDWKGLNNMCHLIMEEITFLNGRVDTCNTILTAVIPAFVGISLSLFFALVSLVISSVSFHHTLAHDHFLDSKSLNDPSVGLTTLMVQLRSSSESLRAIQLSIQQMQEASPESIKSILSELHQVNSHVSEILKALKMFPQNGQSAAEESAIDLLQKSLFSLETASRKDPNGLSIEDKRRLWDEFKKLDDSLDSIATAIKAEKALQVTNKAIFNIGGKLGGPR